MIRQNNRQAAQVKIGGVELRQEIKQKNARLHALKKQIYQNKMSSILNRAGYSYLNFQKDFCLQ
ncbi:hypothetical protein SDC49_17155 [Lactobacillus sp. R2/2]|nr:hypothetical protein [Lactobacillus sp. R2/2]MEB3364625.1 hypothetical protein [Lactobacillus sp. R2/2]